MNSDKVVGIFSLAFSFAYIVAAWLLPDAAIGNAAWLLPDAAIGNPMAPKYFPLGVGAIAFICSAMVLMRGIKRGYVPKKSKADPGYWVLIVGLIVCCLGYAAILELAGFIISTTLFLGAMLFLVNGVKGWIANIAVSVIFSVGVWYVFTKMFLFTLP